MFSENNTFDPSGEPRSNAYVLADGALRLTGGVLEEHLRRTARQHLLDALAAAMIGRRSRLFPCLVPPPVREPSAPEVAMLWSYCINRSVFEDGSREGACHPAAAVVPAVLALLSGADWKRLDRAMSAGYEVMVRLARAGNPGFIRKGFHPTSLAAPFGAAAAGGVMLGLDRNRMAHALSLAALGPSGLIKAFRAAESQPLQVAWGTRAGLYSALLAEAGGEGYPFIIEEGFFPAYLGGDPETPLDAPLEFPSALEGSYLKPTPGCRHLQPSLDALGSAMDGKRPPVTDIDLIKVLTYQTALDMEIDEIKEREDAYFNIPHALAAFLILGRVDYEAFSPDYFSDERFIALRARTTLEADPEFESAYPKKRGAHVELFLRGGGSLAGRVANPWGEPEKPLHPDFTKEKFLAAASGELDEIRTGRLLQLLEEAEHGQAWKELSALARDLWHWAEETP